MGNNKQETTLKEAAEKYYEDNIDESNIPREHYEWEIQDLMIGFANQWQQERSYSEEEVEDLIYKVCGTVARLQGIILNGNHLDTAYKQYKKK
jgi:hypothetical protein